MSALRALKTTNEIREIGKKTSKAEVLNVSPHGFWLFVVGKEYFLGFDNFPGFRRRLWSNCSTWNFRTAIIFTGQNWIWTWNASSILKKFRWWQKRRTGFQPVSGFCFAFGKTCQDASPNFPLDIYRFRDENLM